MALADLPVGFPYRFNSSYTFLFFFTANLCLWIFSFFSELISMTFGMFIVLDKMNRCLKFQVNRTRCRDKCGTKILVCFIIGKTRYTVRRDKNFT